MADEPIVEQDTQKPDEATTDQDNETVEPTVIQDLDQELDVEALQAKADKAEKEKDRMYARAKKAEEENKRLKLKTNDISPAPDPDERFERLELKTEGYNSDEVDFLMQNGGRKALENPIAMAGIDAIRKKAKSTDATPTGTAKSAIFQKYTERDLKKMPVEELEKIIPQD